MDDKGYASEEAYVQLEDETKSRWAHSECGCLDSGLPWCLQNLCPCCIACSFGRMAEVANVGDMGTCTAGLLCGVFVGVHVCGAPVLPCIQTVRRGLVQRYNIDESFGCSLLHTLCCPALAIAQMLQEVEERENGKFSAVGKWTPNQTVVYTTAAIESRE
uniref:Uncharacterized protein n=1 Tax=Pinguiococcus pyrenoidosus TaxID=172671 RepID=A0A7R9U6A4_9STRA|mmetsp:Transcript_16459/g.62558  ORF Transcript_16459/g.62558 Transcript_16459/m.62558 type:complete len:160 (+) Transcript_16459:87-566(+)